MANRFENHKATALGVRLLLACSLFAVLSDFAVAQSKPFVLQKIPRLPTAAAPDTDGVTPLDSRQDTLEKAASDFAQASEKNHQESTAIHPRPSLSPPPSHDEALPSAAVVSLDFEARRDSEKAHKTRRRSKRGSDEGRSLKPGAAQDDSDDGEKKHTESREKEERQDAEKGRETSSGEIPTVIKKQAGTSEVAGVGSRTEDRSLRLHRDSDRGRARQRGEREETKSAGEGEREETNAKELQREETNAREVEMEETNAKEVEREETNARELEMEETNAKEGEREETNAREGERETKSAGADRRERDEDKFWRDEAQISKNLWRNGRGPSSEKRTHLWFEEDVGIFRKTDRIRSRDGPGIFGKLNAALRGDRWLRRTLAKRSEFGMSLNAFIGILGIMMMALALKSQYDAHRLLIASSKQLKRALDLSESMKLLESGQVSETASVADEAPVGVNSLLTPQATPDARWSNFRRRFLAPLLIGRKHARTPSAPIERVGELDAVDPPVHSAVRPTRPPEVDKQSTPREEEPDNWSFFPDEVEDVLDVGYSRRSLENRGGIEQTSKARARWARAKAAAAAGAAFRSQLSEEGGLQRTSAAVS
ncbi:putative transmembrane protein [Toxoplasma gondii RUB]|uniref:Putative transmembrane protein n=4 Tax=Toxoplasma gondii TaxID=5811 RepID=A0A086M8E5_TOXGO|nr:putative transmembrane protein [Toxoplasma gondii GAB2-2007-GAL-DOM2]KFG65163.1 putative transmembrane protein [Toxoplasma gondii RUB]PUA86125.1 putative transmembrane protein [Toxoplasma gondii TgCATBr9]RQX71166.1 putative transmembrane protein [Toxoplasma gondii CAST]